MAPTLIISNRQLKPGERIGNGKKNTPDKKRGYMIIKYKKTRLSFRLHHLLEFLPVFFVQLYFAKTYVLRCYFNALVLLDVFHTLFKRHLYLKSDSY